MTLPGLNPDELRAWRGLIGVLLVGFPRVERRFKEHGLVHIEYGLLVGLSTSPGGRRLSDLAGVTNMSLSRLSHRMAKLAARGLVSLRPSDDDGRVSIAEITAAGRDLVDRIAPGHLADLRRMIFDHLAPAQTAALADAMQAVAGHLGACVDDDAPGAAPDAATPTTTPTAPPTA